MTLPATIRANVRANFPARVIGAGPISIAKSNGVWSIGFSIESLGAPSPLLNTNPFELVAQDPSTGILYSLTAGQLWGSGALLRRTIAQGATIAANTSDGDILVGSGSSAATTVNLFAASLAARPISIVDTTGNAGTNNITINASGSDKINGQSAIVIAADYGAMTLYPLVGGGGWYLK